MRLTKIFWICFPISDFIFLFSVFDSLMSVFTWHYLASSLCQQYMTFGDKHYYHPRWFTFSGKPENQPDGFNLQSQALHIYWSDLIRTSECVLWTFDANTAGCWLKSQMSVPVPVREDFPHQNGWIFGKVPPPHFRKIILRILRQKCVISRQKCVCSLWQDCYILY